MFTLYKISVFIHILSAMFWLGGILFTAGVLVPTFRHKILDPHRGLFFTEMGKRFSNISWVLFSILIITGVFQVIYRGFSVADWGTSAFWNTHFGQTLKFKLIAFVIMLIVSGLHDFWLGPKTTELMNKEPFSVTTKKYRKITGWAGRINLILGLIIIYFALTLVRG